MSSTEIPKAMLNTRRVLGFSAIPKKPMTAAVKIKGTKFGSKLMATIRALLNRIDMMVMAKSVGGKPVFVFDLTMHANFIGEIYEHMRVVQAHGNWKQD